MKAFLCVATAVAVAAFGVGGATTASAQCEGLSPVEFHHTVKYGIGYNNLGLISAPINLTLWALDRCESAGVEVGALGLSIPITRNSSNYTFDFGATIVGAVGQVQDILEDGLGGALPTPEISVNCDYFPVIVHGRGGPSAYAFQMGDPGGPVVWQAEGKLEYCDVVTFTSNEITTVEMPYSLGVSLLAAESFGDPTATRGFAKATITGSVDGHLVLAGADSVESESVTPTEVYMSSSGTVPVALGIGQTQVTIRMSADVYIEAAARAAGLWGLLSGSATAAALWPNSFVIGNFQGVGGAPLPESLRIESAVSGMVYKEGAGASGAGGDIASPALRVRAFPNPGGGAFSLRVDVPGSDPAHVKIYDLRGHLVREIARDLLGNDAMLTWDGKDDDGTPVASGVYHAIVSTASAQRAAKIVVQR